MASANDLPLSVKTDHAAAVRDARGRKDAGLMQEARSAPLRSVG